MQQRHYVHLIFVPKWTILFIGLGINTIASTPVYSAQQSPPALSRFWDSLTQRLATMKAPSWTDITAQVPQNWSLPTFPTQWPWATPTLSTPTLYASYAAAGLASMAATAWLAQKFLWTRPVQVPDRPQDIADVALQRQSIESVLPYQDLCPRGPRVAPPVTTNQEWSPSTSYRDWQEFMYHSGTIFNRDIFPRMHLDHLYHPSLKLPRSNKNYCRSLAIATYLYHVNVYAEAHALLPSTTSDNMLKAECYESIKRLFTQYIGTLLDWQSLQPSSNKQLFENSIQWYLENVPGAFTIDRGATTEWIMQAPPGNSYSHTMHDPNSQKDYNTNVKQYALRLETTPDIIWNPAHATFQIHRYNTAR